MADLRVKKGTNKKKQRNESSPSIIRALPNELLVEILGKVASCSMFDLCKVKLSCKEFLHVAEEDPVYQRASMEKFALVPLPWFKNERESSFLNRCRESGNSEIQYREGMVQYFSSLKVRTGLENLKKAALEGHHGEAKYVYTMILMCCEDEEERRKGFEIFRELKNSSSSCSVGRCRKRVRSFIRSMWVNYHPVVRNRGLLSLCRNSGGACDSGEGLQGVARRRWSWLVEEDEDDCVGISSSSSCEYCDGDYELSLFCKMFEV